MEREELLRVTAKRYAEAQEKVELSDRSASAAKTAAENARLERDRIQKDLEGFVGRHQPRRIVVMENGKAVLIQLDLRDTVGDRVFISVEDAL